MRGHRSRRTGSDVNRLFQFGVVGTMSDVQLLEQFLSREEGAAEAAFEALLIRHGPMVLRICRSTLRNAHDAEDAFQAVFLVLASRARRIRKRNSLASWLFRVAHRVSGRAKHTAARQRALDQVVAQRTLEKVVPTQGEIDWEILHAGIDGLPGHLREPIVLCYFQGLAQDEAAAQLGLSEGAIRGRLARARGRLRENLSRYGLTALVSGTLVEATHGFEASVPRSLLHSTIRIALGFKTGEIAATLAQGVMRSMWLKQLRAATFLLCFGVGAMYWGWTAVATTDDGERPTNSAQTATNEQAAARVSRPDGRYRLTGTLRVEGTGQPVAGTTFGIFIAFSDESRDGDTVATRSGTDGRFEVALPPGNAAAFGISPPIGYWAPRKVNGIEEFVVSAATPEFQRDYVVRRGTVWRFGVPRANPKASTSTSLRAFNDAAYFLSATDNTGRLVLTLPTEGDKVTIIDGRCASQASKLTLEWESNFRPDHIESLTKLEQRPATYRMIDDQGKIAKISVAETAHAEPTLEDGELVIYPSSAGLPSESVGDLVGKVVDAAGTPIADAHVVLVWVGDDGSAMCKDDDHKATTDVQGRFRLRSISRTYPVTGRPSTIRLSVTKPGFAGMDSPKIPFRPTAEQGIHVAETLTLERGESLQGTVVAPDGKPAAGVWVRAGGGYASVGQSSKTDDQGRFRIRDLPEGMVPLTFRYGKLRATGKFLAVPGTDSLEITLRPVPDVTADKPRIDALKPARPQPIAIGSPAPEWETGPWSDDRPRTLADYRGKVVVLDFWGIWCDPCINGLTSLERTRTKYEPRGVVFLSIHTPHETARNVRKVLEWKKTSLVFAVDRPRKEGDPGLNGLTAERYGVHGYPTVLIIDADGKVVFSTSDQSAMRAAYDAAINAQGSGKHDDGSQPKDRVLDQAISNVLDARTR
jgi:RNA polymerase sigma factor (sigma-70 family)